MGLIDSNKCGSCGLVETAEHQLFDCPNAVCKWQWLDRIASLDEDSYQRVCCSSNETLELMKAVVFKMLIQIDRSRSMSFNQFKSALKYWINIEIAAMKRQVKLSCVKKWEALIGKIDNTVI